MSMLIKGMEMPSGCTDCPVWAVLRCQSEINLSTRPRDCPLVPVPPHGRLIDADKLKEAAVSKDWSDEDSEDIVYVSDIDDAFTIIPAGESIDIQKEFMPNWHEEDIE